jgi:hypothetical protein
MSGVSFTLSHLNRFATPAARKEIQCQSTASENKIKEEAGAPSGLFSHFKENSPEVEGKNYATLVGSSTAGKKSTQESLLF